MDTEALATRAKFLIDLAVEVYGQENRTGCAVYMVSGKDRATLTESEPLLRRCFPINGLESPLFKEVEWMEAGKEKVARTAGYPTTISSYESREVCCKKFGGGIVFHFRTDIFGVGTAGMDEDACDAVSIALPATFGIITIEDVALALTRSKNTRFHEFIATASAMSPTFLRHLTPIICGLSYTKRKTASQS